MDRTALGAVEGRRCYAGRAKLTGRAAWGKRSGLGCGGGSTQGWGADVWAGTQRKGGFDWVGEGAVAGVDIAAASSPETGETGSLGFYRAWVA